MASTMEKFIEDLTDLSDIPTKKYCRSKNVKTPKPISNDLSYPYFHDLISSSHYLDLMHKINSALVFESNDISDLKTNLDRNEDEDISLLLIECNKLIVEIEDEINIIHNINKDLYRPRFPELESLVQNPVEYAKIIKTIGNEKYISQVDLDKVLTSSNIMVVAATASASNGELLSEDNLNKIMEGCRIVLKLDSDKKQILSVIEKEIKKIAPNISMVLGSEITAKLISSAGGLTKLSKIPACNIKAIGSIHMNDNADSSSTALYSYQGVVSGCEIVQQTPPKWREKAIKYLSTKTALLSKIDAYGQDPNGYLGRNIREKAIAVIERWQEQSKTTVEKPLPIPNGTKRSQRGGRRFSKLKLKNVKLTMSKAANRIEFCPTDNQKADWDETIYPNTYDDYNRVKTKRDKKTQKLKKRVDIMVKDTSYKKGISTFSSPLALTPVQGIELTSRYLRGTCDTLDGAQTYFCNLSGFKCLKK